MKDRNCSEDIDPENTDAVVWSLAYRSNPIEDVHVEPYRSTGHAPKSGPGEFDSTLLIDATLKYPMAPLALPGREFMERARTLWKELGLPAITPHSPWHGYSLGDWNKTWDTSQKMQLPVLGRRTVRRHGYAVAAA